MELSQNVTTSKTASVEESEAVKKGSEPSKKEVLDLAVTAINKLSGSVTGEISEIANTLEKLAEKSTRTFLLAFGGTMIAFSVIMKLDVYGVHVAKIEPKEFISMMVLGVLLVFAGTAFELFRYNREMGVYQESVRAIQLTRNQLAEMAETGMRTVAKISENTTEGIMKSVVSPIPKPETH